MTRQRSTDILLCCFDREVHWKDGGSVSACTRSSAENSADRPQNETNRESMKASTTEQGMKVNKEKYKNND